MPAVVIVTAFAPDVPLIVTTGILPLL